MRRFERLDVCSECGFCGGKLCESARSTDLRNYGGIRHTADGFDCALPITIDSHSACSFGCLYCFSDNLSGHVRAQGMDLGLGQTSLRTLEGVFSGQSQSKASAAIRKALKYHARNELGFPCAVQLGGITDPGDNIERNQGWFLEFAEIVRKYRQPVRISTKGTTFLAPEYLKCFAKSPELFWVAFSIISIDDDLVKRIDVGTPVPSERLKVMKALSALGVKTSLRMRPMFPKVSDSTRKHPHAYRELIERAAEAGACAISYECGFYPSRIPVESKGKWERFTKLLGVPLKETYAAFGSQACIRPHHLWTENIMHAVKEVAVKCGLTVGVSDPIWKQLSDSGCCCGIRPDDPVFGNWERENATHALLEAKKHGHVIRLEDVLPPWADDVLLAGMVATPAGPLGMYKAKHATWGDHMRNTWNDPLSERSPLTYFQGAVRPVKLEDGSVGYKYVGLERKFPKHVPYWSDRLVQGKGEL